MRNYPPSASSRVRIRFGERLVRGLGRVDETKPLIASVTRSQAPLVEAEAARQALEKPVENASDDVAYGEVVAESKLRRLNRRTQELDGDRAGPITLAGFPNGLTVALAPKGKGQVDECEAIVKRYTESNLPGVEAVRAELVGLANEALTAIKVPYDGWIDAKKKLALARTVENIRRDEHRRSIDSVFGGIREALPGDAALQNALVPRIDVRKKAQADEEVADDAETPVADDADDSPT